MASAPSFYVGFDAADADITARWNLETAIPWAAARP
jgi:hypothetical protein